MLKQDKAHHETAVSAYFRDKASQYDLVENQAYWRLSDALLWTMLRQLVDSMCGPSFRFLDAGGGTGRWSERLLKHFPGATGVTMDLSPDMLGVADAKREAAAQSYGKRWATRLGDLHELDEQAQYDLVICTHNVLGFVWEPERVMANLMRAAKPGGCVALVVPNKYHGIYFNMSLQNIDVADSISKTGLGTFTSNMPVIDFFDPTGLTKTLTGFGAAEVSVRGFPLFVYPGHQETQLNGQTISLAKLLEDQEYFDRILAVETYHCDNAAAAWRGNNLLAVARVRDEG